MLTGEKVGGLARLKSAINRLDFAHRIGVVLSAAMLTLYGPASTWSAYSAARKSYDMSATACNYYPECLESQGVIEPAFLGILGSQMLTAFVFVLGGWILAYASTFAFRWVWQARADQK